ncbi:MAG: methyl-accepting chemotaxis protein, partial [Solirubrobacteraceae bacterium]
MPVDQLIGCGHSAGNPRMMRVYRDISLKWKLCLLAGVLMALLAAEGVLAATGGPDAMLRLVLACVGVAFGALVTLVTVPALHRDAKLAHWYMNGAATATRLQLMTGLQALAAGDLTVELRAGSTGTGAPPKASADEMGQMVTLTGDLRETMIAAYDAYNRATAQLRQLIGEVELAADNVHQASVQMTTTSEESGRTSGEIAEAVEGVAHGAQVQVDQVNAARAAALIVVSVANESHERIQRAAEMAAGARALAQQGVQAAERAGETMHVARGTSEDVTAAIRELADHSEQIGTIVQAITGIAEQTNLLALNAAIEAARAGEQGRGFAVVAEEVRKLAEGSQAAAEEISRLIATIQSKTAHAVGVVEESSKQTATGVQVVDQARESFQEIDCAVHEMTVEIGRLADGASEMAGSAGSVLGNIDEVAGVAERSSATTQELSAST